jgi:GNAT superfamily N-acetyltransferase
MPLPDGYLLRDATLADLPAIAEMREAVGWGVQEWALRAVIGQTDARCLIVEAPEGTAAAVGSGIVYRPIGFVGNMIVAEAHRRRGLGAVVLETISDFLADAGCTRLELNATSAGRPLYERHGFASVGSSDVAHLPRTAPLAPASDVAVRAADASDLERVADYDRSRFGGDRRRILAAQLAEPGITLLVAEREGRVSAYGMLNPAAGRIGPLLADGPDVAAAIVAEAFAREPELAEIRLNLRPGNVEGVAWLASVGIATEPWDGFMARGSDVPRRPETIYGMAIGALG